MYLLPEVELLVQRNASSPQGPLTLSSTHAQLDSHWETAAGDTSYPGYHLHHPHLHDQLQHCHHNPTTIIRTYLYNVMI